MELSKKSTGHGTVTEKYVTPLLTDLVDFDLNEWNETKTVSNTITKLLLKHSYPLFSPSSNRKRKHGVSVRLSDDVKTAQACSENMSPEQFWSIADLYPDLVRHLHVQVRLMGKFGINGGVRQQIIL